MFFLVSRVESLLNGEKKRMRKLESGARERESAGEDEINGETKARREASGDEFFREKL